MTTPEEMNRMLMLFHRINEMLDGEDLLDVASVGSLVMTFALIEAFPSRATRLKALDGVYAQMQKMIETKGEQK